jgi:hypothetical protein
MPNRPQRAAPVVGALTMLAERWVSQDVARGNAAAAASRLRRQRAELAEVDMFLATHQRRVQDVGNHPRARRTSPAP